MGTIKQKMFSSKAFILQILTISAFLVVLASAQFSSLPECSRESFCLECQDTNRCSKCSTAGRYIDQATTTCRRKMTQSWVWKCKYYAINKSNDTPNFPDCWQCEDNLKWLNINTSPIANKKGNLAS